MIAEAAKVAIKAGGGTRGHDRGDQAACRGRRSCGDAFARLDRSTAGRACAEHACRRLEGLDQRQLCHGGGRAC